MATAETTQPGKRRKASVYSVRSTRLFTQTLEDLILSTKNLQLHRRRALRSSLVIQSGLSGTRKLWRVMGKVTDLTLNQRITRPLSSTETAVVADWCREYQKKNPWPADFSKRFAIGLYQIYQGLVWDRSQPPNIAESMMAGAIHFLMVMEELDLFWFDLLPKDLKLIETRDIECRDMLIRISRAQQHILYATQMKGKQGTVKTGRSTRYDADLLCRDLSWLVRALVAKVPSHLREQGIEDATRIMTKRL